MINPVKEAIYSATYVDNYIDSVENLPDDVQRHLSRIRDIDVQYRNLLRDVDHYYDLWRTLQSTNDANSSRRSRAITRMQQSLIQAQELGDEKMKVVNQLQELIDHKTRQLDTDQKNLDIKEGLQQHMQTHMQLMDDCHGPTPQKRSRTQSPVREMLNSSGQQVNGGNAAAGSGFERSLSAGKDGYGGYGYSGTQVLSGQAPGTQSIGERTLSQSNGVLGNGSQVGNGNTGVGNMSSASAEQLRAGGKRARRRNETLNSLNMEHTGNDSNSANETGSNSAERALNQGRTGGLTASSGSVGSKKHLTQNQGGLISAGQTTGGTMGIGGVGASSTGAAGISGSGSGGGVGGTGVSNTGGGGSSSSNKKKKRKTRGGTSHAANVQVNQREETPPPDPIDPDEPTYCVCNQISFGEMILCDNDLCPIEWFHFSCVSLVLKPKGKWYCPNCRGDRPNVMKPKAQFLKELERYNKEKEEKT